MMLFSKVNGGWIGRHPEYLRVHYMELITYYNQHTSIYLGLYDAFLFITVVQEKLMNMLWSITLYEITRMCVRQIIVSTLSWIEIIICFKIEN